jgi:hypothetical protein
MKIPTGNPAQDWLVIPFVMLLGLFFIGSVIQQLFGIPNAAKYVFWAVGGLPLFVLYFKRLTPYYLAPEKPRPRRRKRSP